MPRRLTGRAYARAGLLGNPSDLYQGKAIALSIFDFSASVHLDPAESDPGVEVEVGPGAELLRAALGRFRVHAASAADAPPGAPSFRMSFETTIPRQAGLAGSSAIVVAALRVLCQGFDVEIPAAELAELALAAEVEDLGITAGPMDRVIQAYEGVLAMDFTPPRSPASYRAIDPAWLPPLFLAWDPQQGRASGAVHSDVRQRWLRGDPDVREAMAIFPGLVDEGLECLEQGDLSGFRALVDRNFDTRRSIFSLSERDLALVETGRSRGAAVKLCGSGGAVVGVMDDAAHFEKLQAAYADAGFRALRLFPRSKAPAR